MSFSGKDQFKPTLSPEHNPNVITSFDALDVSRRALQLNQENTTCTVPMKLDGQECTFEAEYTLEDDKIHIYDFYIVLDDDSTALSGEVICIDKETYIKTETSILRSDGRTHQETRKLPNEIGSQLYRKMLDFIQMRANQTGHTHRHIVTMHPHISGKDPLTSDKWKKIFLPILNDDGRQYQLRRDKTHMLKDVDTYMYDYTPPPLAHKHA